MADMGVKTTLDCLLNLPIELSILISGNHGIGKSQVVKQAAKILGIPCIDFRLSQNDVSDMKGMPFHINGRTVFAPPEFFPLMEKDASELKKILGLAENISLGRYGDKGILFLDEINRANREVQQAAFELVLDRRLNLRSLPPGWRVVSAINGDDDLYNVNAMEPAFLSRFFLIDFKPSNQEWFAWAESDGCVHSSIIEFLRKMPEFIDPTKEYIEEQSKAGVKKVHDRRAWEMFSKTICKFEDDFNSGTRTTKFLSKTPAELSFLIQIATGFVGHMAGLKFATFIELDYDALNADIILNKFNDEIKKKVQKIVDAGRIPELGSYNELILAYLKKFVKANLTKKMGDNLGEYFMLLPKELAADLWTKWNHEQGDIANAWYAANKTGYARAIKEALISPNATKK